MQRKLTITVDEQVYRGLHEQVGRGNISGFIENLVRPHIVIPADLEEGYRAMAADEEHEREAAEWSEGLIGQTLG
ncbi:MAG: addiction module antitoxin [Chloroflexota bacterium]|nr:addiction module antitoxin [Chloroflexota bacterium]